MLELPVGEGQMMALRAMCWWTAYSWAGLRRLNAGSNVLLGRFWLPALSGALTVELCWSWPWQKSVTSPSCLPCLAARSHCPLWWSVLGTAGRFLICVQCNFSEDLNN